MIAICDIDGTAADIEHRRHWVEEKPKRWDKFFDEMVYDAPNPWCVELLMALSARAHDIWFVTGRPEGYRTQTEAWLKEFYSPLVPQLLMRPAGNSEPDYKIKRDIYEQHFADKKPEILFVVDDRQRVVDMWRSLGLTVLQCDVGDF